MALRTSLVAQPHLYMGDTQGRPLDAGKVYFGEPNKDPELYPIDVFYDEALTIAAPQPIRTQGGFMNANGQMTEVYAAEIEYSVKVLDGYGRQVFYQESMSSENAQLQAQKLDTGITATAKFGGVERPQASVNSDYINVNDFGDFSANPKAVLQSAINKVSAMGGGEINVPAGVFDFSSGGVVLKSNVQISGAGEGATIFDQREFVGDLITTPTVAEIPLTMTSDLNEGDIEHSITNNCAIGDFIKFASNKLFTDRWSTREVRPYYLEGELFEVARCTASTVGFNKAGFAICKLADNATAITFKPTKGMSLKNLTLRKSSSVINTSRGLVISQAKGFTYANITTEYYDSAGIVAQKSIGTSGGRTHHVGGSSTTGLTYGTLYSDGAKDSYAEQISGDGCRHTVSGGGTGWAIPAHNVVGNIKAVNSKSVSIDTHGNTAYFSYKSAQVDNIGGMSGLGHILSDVVGMGGDEAIAANSLSNYEGGRDITYRNIFGNKHGRWVDNQATVNCSYEKITLVSENFTSIAKTPAVFGTRGNKFKDIRLVCTKAANALSNTAADACHTTSSMYHVGNMLRPDSTLDGLYVEGFPFILQTNATDLNIKNVIAVNCGWATSLATGIGAIDIKSSDGLSLDDLDIKNTNTNLTYGNYGLRVYTASAEHKNIMLTNVTNRRTATACRPYYSVYTDAKLIKPVLINVKIENGGLLGVFGAGAGTYINQNLTADTYTKTSA